MFRKGNFWIVIAILAAIIGCKGDEGPQGPQGPSGSEPPLIWVIGQIAGPTMWDSTADANFDIYYISHCLDIPIVRINSTEIPFYDINPMGVIAYYENDFPVIRGDSVSLLITYTKTNGATGTARAYGMFPQEFGIISPDTSSTYTITKGDSLTVIWSASTGASYYLADLHFDYRYIDTSGNYKSLYISHDTILTDTSITFSSSFLFPNLAEIDSIRWGDGYFDVWAYNGPEMEGGSQGNLEGDAVGFFIGGDAYSGILYINVENSPLLLQNKINHEERIRKLLRQKARELLLLN
jgi:hypothetical protein